MGIIQLSKNKKGTRRSKFKPVKRPRNRFDLFVLYAKRFGRYAGVCVFTVWIGAWLYLSGSFLHMGAWANARAVDASADMGFVVQNVMVEGREYTDPDVLLGLLNVGKGDALFGFDPVDAKNLLERISWVKSARVQRRWPDTIYVELQERKPLALWKRGDDMVVIDRDGEALTDYKPERFSGLIAVAGNGANKNAFALIGMLAAEPDLRPHIRAAQFIGKRRWSLFTERGVEIKLPQEDVGVALRRLSLENHDHNLLSMALEYIDLRDPSRMMIKTRSSGAQEFKAMVGQMRSGSGAKTSDM